MYGDRKKVSGPVKAKLEQGLSSRDDEIVLYDGTEDLATSLDLECTISQTPTKRSDNGGCACARAYACTCARACPYVTS